MDCEIVGRISRFKTPVCCGRGAIGGEMGGLKTFGVAVKYLGISTY